MTRNLILMSSTLCDLCHQRAATVFVTKIVNNHASKHRLCADCARRSAGNALEAAGDLNADISQLPLEDIVRNLLTQQEGITLWGKNSDADESSKTEKPSQGEVAQGEVEFSWAMGLGEFPGDEDAVDELDEADDETDALADDVEESVEDTTSSTQVFGDIAKQLRASSGIIATRCPKCDTTWDRLRQDGRAGCAQCYSAFANELSQVMERVQRASQHAGKAPRTAEKRHRRLLHLRARRDHRLEMLNRRLAESVAQEKYEEAAKLRDKIKILTSTIVDE